MKHLYLFFFILIFTKCDSYKEDSYSKKKLDFYFEQSLNSSLDKEDRLRFIDSANLIVEKIKNNDSIKIKNYFKIANRYFILLEYENYKNVTSHIYRMSNLIGDTINSAKAEYYLGDYYFSLSKNDSAYYYYSSAEKKYKATEDKPNLANTILHKAYILLYEKDFLESESETIKVLNIAKELNDEFLIYECFVNLGSALSGLGNYEKALEYHFKALEQIDRIPDENYRLMFKAQTLNNLGSVYLKSSKYSEAKNYFKEGLKTKRLRNIQPVLYSALLDNFAFSKYKFGEKIDDDEFIEALEIRDSIKDIAGKINSRIHLTEYYLSKRDTAKALQFNQEANLLAKESSYNKEVLITLDFFTRLLPKQGLEYARAYIKLNDSLQNQERATRNKLARIAFETDEIIVEKEALSTQKKIILLTSLFIISLGVLLYIILYQRGKQKELLFEQEQQKVNEEIYTLMLKKQHEIDFARENEKLKIARDLHDNVLNKLASTRLNLFPLSKRQDEETIQKAIGQINGIINIESEIRLISHELAKEEFLNRNNFKTLVEELMENQKATYSVACEYDITDHEALENIGSAIKMHLYRIIQETLNNINKHANATKITVELYIQKEKLYLEIADNGVGFNVDKAKKGIGLKNIYMRTKEINGRIDVVSEKNKGTKITVKVRI